MAKDNNKRGYEEAFDQDTTETMELSKDDLKIADFKQRLKYWKDFFRGLSPKRRKFDEFEVQPLEGWAQFARFMIDNIKSDNINTNFSFGDNLQDLFIIIYEVQYPFEKEMMDLLNQSLEAKNFYLAKMVVDSNWSFTIYTTDFAKKICDFIITKYKNINEISDEQKEERQKLENILKLIKITDEDLCEDSDPEIAAVMFDYLTKDNKSDIIGPVAEDIIQDIKKRFFRDDFNYNFEQICFFSTIENKKYILTALESRPDLFSEVKSKNNMNILEYAVVNNIDIIKSFAADENFKPYLKKIAEAKTDILLQITNINNTKIFGFLVKLMEDTPNINILDTEYNTALHHACKVQNMNNVKLLLESGIDTELKNRLGQRAFDLLPKNIARNFQVFSQISVVTKLQEEQSKIKMLSEKLAEISKKRDLLTGKLQNQLRSIEKLTGEIKESQNKQELTKELEEKLLSNQNLIMKITAEKEELILEREWLELSNLNLLKEEILIENSITTLIFQLTKVNFLAEIYLSDSNHHNNIIYLSCKTENMIIPELAEILNERNLLIEKFQSQNQLISKIMQKRELRNKRELTEELAEELLSDPNLLKKIVSENKELISKLKEIISENKELILKLKAQQILRINLLKKEIATEKLTFNALNISEPGTTYPQIMILKAIEDIKKMKLYYLPAPGIIPANYLQAANNNNNSVSALNQNNMASDSEIVKEENTSPVSITPHPTPSNNNNRNITKS